MDEENREEEKMKKSKDEDFCNLNDSKVQVFFCLFSVFYIHINESGLERKC